MLRSRLKTTIFAAIAVTLAISLISFPAESLAASTKGLNTWWKVVFPSLLPFFIVAELLIGFGVVKFIGVLLEPLMRPIFRVPGVGGFVWAMGMASGNPAGAKFTVRMRQEKQITKIEGERLVSFTSSANPLFIFGAVAVGFFNNAALGIIFAIAHYVGNICVGLIMRFHGKKETKEEISTKFSIKEAFRALHHTRVKEKRPLGKILGDAVISSIQTLLMIGGFMILFSVINRLLSILHITDFIALFVKIIFSMFSISEDLSVPFISGLFEMTIGSQLISEVQNTALLQQAVVVSFLLAFGGFSIQAQVASLLAQADMRLLPFLIARLFHGFFAALITVILWKPLYENRLSGMSLESIPAFLQLHEQPFSTIINYLLHNGPIITIISLIIYIIVYARRMTLEK
ncbi:sporulation integral membrane protein YlbJ [Caldibacillus lycopersici]|uniref:Sporulation integral membrane protein YlbJ n=1 Tax=Perspicuibacillus lycopersici TaxID=1325689 RepID=A0AAE3LPD0_9BACI|nr:sporulation integral membrane protein YlbJ [Perspicuibacillus lycopersici]MCU9612219.1 sporulation integral membrane protein YlbJ [Perspicuibacillus lycopersici]